MPRAIAVSNTPVINLGLQGEKPTGFDYTMQTINSMHDRSEQEARDRADQFKARLAAYASRPDIAKALTEKYVADNPDQARFLSAYTVDMPLSDEAKIGKQSKEWVLQMLPQVEKALQDGTAVNPHLLSALRPYLSMGDKAMEQHEYEDAASQFNYTDKANLPPEYVQRQRYKDKLDVTPAEELTSSDKRYGDEMQFAGQKYGADQSLKGTEYSANTRAAADRYGVDANAAVRGSEVTKNTSMAGYYDRMPAAAKNTVELHPAVLAGKAHIADLMQQRNAALAQSRTGRTPEERQAAAAKIEAFNERIRVGTENLQGLRERVAEHAGGADQTGIDPVAPFNVPPAAPAQPPPSQQQPRRSREQTLGPSPQMQQMQQMAGRVEAQSGGIDRAHKTITRAALQQLQQQTGQAFNTSGWTVLP